VTKNVAIDRIQKAFEAGIRDFGENRVQELLEKKPHLPSDIRWHFVGHLQTNKVKSLLGEAALIHSLDRISLAEEIERQAEKKNLKVDALVQVNTSGETTKSGFSPEEVGPALENLKRFDRIRLRGLMTIGPFTEDANLIRQSFRTLRGLRDSLRNHFADLRVGAVGEPPILSMGMSSDFELAIEEGATIVRIGTALFGKRNAA